MFISKKQAQAWKGLAADAVRVNRKRFQEARDCVEWWNLGLKNSRDKVKLRAAAAMGAQEWKARFV